jgi:hypothetical protein
MLSRFTLPAILLLLTLGFGLWVSLTGKPYHSALFNVHKLAALAAAILATLRVVQVLKLVHPQALLIALLALAGLSVLALFATGAMLSIGTSPYRLILIIHRVALFLLPLAMLVAVYLLSKGT